MSKITLKGNPINTVGELPKIGTEAPDFILTKTDLSEFSLRDCQGKKVVLSIFPSLDTPTCATSVRHFNEAANKLENTLVLCVSADLPFAQTRFCGAENLSRVMPVSVFRHPEFGKQYGVTIVDGPLAGLLSRAVIVLNEKGQVIYAQQVSEIADEPDYNAALAALNSMTI
ncbi:MAG: thiol peroxidase [Gammaproteobacteria bacterium]|nr:thiol peroxidase [Gammaproteobacteria bacterium]